MDSILNTIKIALGVDADYNGFDTNILLDVNSAISTLNQLGVGPSSGFVIKGENETWQGLLGASTQLELAKSYILHKVRLSFDPPTNSYLVDAIQKNLQELEWRLMIEADPRAKVYESALFDKKHGISILENLPLAIDYGANALKAIYHYGHRNGLFVRAHFDGIYSYLDCYSPELVRNYQGDETTIIFRAKVESPAIWTDGLQHGLFGFYPFNANTDEFGAINIYKDVGNNNISFFCALESGFFNLHTTPLSSSLWFSVAITFSQLGNEMKMYLNGVQVGTTVSPLSAWNDAYPISNGLLFGGTSTGVLNKWAGWMADGIIGWSKVASPQQISVIHSNLRDQILNPYYLDTVFGVGNYAWWKLDEEE